MTFTTTKGFFPSIIDEEILHALSKYLNFLISNIQRSGVTTVEIHPLINLTIQILNLVCRYYVVDPC